MNFSLVPRFVPRATAARLLAAALLFSAALAAQAAPADAALALRDKHAALQAELANNIFHQPIHLDSSEDGNRFSGDIYAVMDHPYANVLSTFKSPSNWCEVMILHLNTKYCRAAGQGMAMGIGSKKPEAADKASRLDFSFRPVATTPDYLQVALASPKGPLGTSNYRITLEAIPLGPKRSFLHFSYSYEASTTGRLAMQAYLATAGHGKVGFTVVDNSGGAPKFIAGPRGVVERNTMRYYIAIDAYLDSLAKPSAEQLEARLQGWYDQSEKYARQLHEVERGAYLEMKRDEVRRQQTMDVSLLEQQ